MECGSVLPLLTARQVAPPHRPKEAWEENVAGWQASPSKAVASHRTP
jgi:hypothetical protein